VHGVFPAKFTKLFQLQAVLQGLLVFAGKIICMFALLALHFYKIILRHIIKFFRRGFAPLCLSEPLSGFEPETFSFAYTSILLLEG